MIKFIPYFLLIMREKNLLVVNCPVCGNEVEVHNRKAKRCHYCGCSFVKQSSTIKILDTKGIKANMKERKRMEYNSFNQLENLVKDFCLSGYVQIDPYSTYDVEHRKIMRAYDERYCRK